MKKKELFEQNALLHNRLKTTSAELEKYKELYAQNITEINSLREEIEKLISKHTEVLQMLADFDEQSKKGEVAIVPSDEAKPTALDVELEDVSEYGAEIIGKIVLEGTKINNLFAEKQNDLSLDVINLILGKTEVCKAKIYDICHSSIEDQKRKEMLDSLYTECMDYFASLSGQIQ